MISTIFVVKKKYILVIIYRKASSIPLQVITRREESAMAGVGACEHHVFAAMNIYRSLLPLATGVLPRSSWSRYLFLDLRNLLLEVKPLNVLNSLFLRILFLLFFVFEILVKDLPTSHSEGSVLYLFFIINDVFNNNKIKSYS